MSSSVEFILAFQKLLRRTSAFRLLLQPDLPISPAQFFLLLTLKQQGRSTAKELAAKMGVTAPAMTTGTTKLIEMGLVDRQVDPADRRRAFLSLTDEGIDVVGELLVTASGVLDEFFSGLNVAETRTFLSLLKKMTEVPRADA